MPSVEGPSHEDDRNVRESKTELSNPRAAIWRAQRLLVERGKECLERPGRRVEDDPRKGRLRIRCIHV
jgi:hypothetical protein